MPTLPTPVFLFTCAAANRPPLLAILIMALALITVQPTQAEGYGEALQKSILFYEAQQSGRLPDWNRVHWRGDSALSDGAGENLDLSGGWYDAGDHVKFGLPMASAATMLAWGMVEYPEAYERSGQKKHLLNNLRFVAEYFIKAHPEPDRFYAQIGLGKADHAWWGPAEVVEFSGSEAANRLAFFISEQCKGSDVAGETSAALAAMAIVFGSDRDFRTQLLKHARELYRLAVSYEGYYSDCIGDAADFYPSSGYTDELIWAAAWLYRATGEAHYLEAAEAGYAHFHRMDYAPTRNNIGSTQKPDRPNESGTVMPFNWTHSWDQKIYGVYVLMAQLTGNSEYEEDAQRWLDYWTTGVNGHKVTYTPGGLAHLSEWGSARYAANTAWLAMVYKDYLVSKRKSRGRQITYSRFARSQIDYLLGANPANLSYLIGYGEQYPLNPHHRTAHASWSNDIQSPTENRHRLIGALVGGPDMEDKHNDERGDHKSNEVAVDYNAGFTSALARLYLDFGGSPLREMDFPEPERIVREYPVKAQLYSRSRSHLELGVQIENHSAWPARNLDNFTIRYWANLPKSEMGKLKPSQMKPRIQSDYSRATELKAHAPKPWDIDNNIWYIDFEVVDADVAPVGMGREKAVFKIWMEIPNGQFISTNDPSWNEFSERWRPANGIGIYQNGNLIAGVEPLTSVALPLDEDPSTNAVSADLPGKVECELTLPSDWGNGFIATLSIHNRSEKPVSGWQLQWHLPLEVRIDNHWNFQLAEKKADRIKYYQARPLDWNRVIEPGKSTSIGFQGSKRSREQAIPPIELSGDVCETLILPTE